MKKQSETGGEGSFMDRLRNRLVHGTDVARRMIQRMRELLEQEELHPPTTAERGGVSQPSVPRHGGQKSWAPTRPTTEPTHPTPETTAPAGATVETHPETAKTTTKTETEETTVTTQQPTQTAPPTSEPTSETEEEPLEVAAEFATVTMGKILLQQGRVRQALQVFVQVLKKNPNDTEAQRELKRCQDILGIHPEENKLPTQQATEPPEPEGMLDRSPPPPAYGVCEARTLPVDPTTVVVFWEMTSDALTEAAHTIGPDASRSLYLVSIVQQPTGSQRIERFIDGIPQTGDYFVTGLPAGAIHHAAVGLHKGERFVPVALATPVTTPRGRPSPQVAQVQGTLALPPRTEHHRPEPPRIVQLAGLPEQVSDLVHTYPSLASSERIEAAPPPAVVLGPRPGAPTETVSTPPASSFDLIAGPQA